jgi:hypothetical protein
MEAKRQQSRCSTTVLCGSAYKRRSQFLLGNGFKPGLRTRLSFTRSRPNRFLSHRVNIHTEQDLRDWFEKEYKPALEFIRVRSRKYIHNINEKSCRLACPTREDVVVPVRIKEMYVRVPENRLSVTVVESISADSKAIPPLVIVPGRNIIMSWFSEQMTGAEVISVLLSGYTNKGICMQ